ncbi:MAG TPA: c-type cytochrome domain-containing protein [Planctomycetaceae bacterium]|nr:c-type cytochrome domain-containing protein [Planctomycetaceae bacterium]
MSKPTLFVILAVIDLLLPWGLFPRAVAETDDDLPPPTKREVDFAKEIKPIFADRCLKCHGPEKQESGFRLDRKADALEGGKSGPAIEVGKSADSLLIRYVAGTDADIIMPPQGGRLTKEQISVLRGWIDQGAKWAEE